MTAALVMLWVAGVPMGHVAAHLIGRDISDPFLAGFAFVVVVVGGPVFVPLAAFAGFCWLIGRPFTRTARPRPLDDLEPPSPRRLRLTDDREDRP